jgi:hypothetical protein
MASQIISPASGSVPKQGSDPLSQNPNSIAFIDYSASSGGVQRIDVKIEGIGNVAGYTAGASVIVEHFDPFSNAIVRDRFIIPGGYNSNVISFAVGNLDPNTPYAGQAKIAIYDFNAGSFTSPFGSGPMPVPGLINRLLDTLGLADKLTQTNATNAAFNITNMGGGPVSPTDPAYITSLARNSDRQIVQQFSAPSPCFAAGTPILMANGTKKPIEEIRIGDMVLAFDSRIERGRGHMIPRKVVRLFENVTDEWMLLSLVDNQRDREVSVVVTPSHRFLSADGEFRSILEVVSKQLPIVLGDGSLANVEAQLLSYGVSTACRYPEAEVLEFPVAGSASLQPRRKTGWRTFNFEVEGLHTYVAAGIRVHNDCEPTLAVSSEQFAAMFGHSFDGSEADINQLLSAVASGQLAAAGEFVGTSDPQRLIAPFYTTDGDKIVVTRDSSTWLASMVKSGQIDRIIHYNNDGGGTDKLLDPQNTHPYNELDVTKAADGKVTGAQLMLDQSVINAGGAIGQIFGSALGSALGGKDQLTKLVGGAAGGVIGGLIGQKFGLVVATSMAADLSKVSLADVFASQNLDIGSAGLGAVSSFLTAELGNALHIPGFGGQLFNAASNGFTLSVLTQVKTSIANGLTFEGAIAAIDWSAAVSGAISAEGLNIVNLAGSFLGQLLVPAKSHAGEIGGQLLGAIGSLIVPGLGTLIGDILGTVIGDLFGNTPHPAATDLLDQAGYLYAATHYQTSASDGGAFSVPDQMADPALAIINGYLGAVKGAALDHSKQVTLGYQTAPQPSYIVGVPSHPAAGVFFGTGYAVQAAAVDVLQHTEVIGGDLLLKRAHQNSSFYDPPPMPPADPSGDPGPTGAPIQPIASTQLAIMSGDLGVAQDYENYLNNREAINALMAANPNSAFTAGWNRARRRRMTGHDNRNHERRLLHHPGMARPLTRCA